MGTARPQTRTREQVLEFFSGLELVGPGLVFAPQWRTSDEDDAPWGFAADAARSGTHVGVGYKPFRAGADQPGPGRDAPHQTRRLIPPTAANVLPMKGNHLWLSLRHLADACAADGRVRCDR
jgi:hypothetical protein